MTIATACPYANPRPQHDTCPCQRSRVMRREAAETARSRGAHFLGVIVLLYWELVGGNRNLTPRAFQDLYHSGRPSVASTASSSFLRVITPLDDQVRPRCLLGLVSWHDGTDGAARCCSWLPRAYRPGHKPADVFVDAIARQSCVNLRVERFKQHMTVSSVLPATHSVDVAK
jgi:hypothetical protein